MLDSTDGKGVHFVMADGVSFFFAFDIALTFKMNESYSGKKMFDFFLILVRIISYSALIF